MGDFSKAIAKIINNEFTRNTVLRELASKEPSETIGWIRTNEGKSATHRETADDIINALKKEGLLAKELRQAIRATAQEVESFNEEQVTQFITDLLNRQAEYNGRPLNIGGGILVTDESAFELGLLQGYGGVDPTNTDIKPDTGENLYRFKVVNADPDDAYRLGIQIGATARQNDDTKVAGR